MLVAALHLVVLYTGRRDTTSAPRSGCDGEDEHGDND